MELLSENQLNDLEARIDKLIEGYQAIKEEKEALLSTIRDLESENTDLKERMSDAKSEKDVIIDKISKILEKIEKTEL